MCYAVRLCVVTQNTVILALAQPALAACGSTPAFVLLLSDPLPNLEMKAGHCGAVQLSVLSVCHVSRLSSLL